LVGSFLLVISSFAQIPSGYYDSAAGKTGEALRAALRDITSAGHVKLPYTASTFDVWDAYAVTDVRPAPDNTIIWDMYSDIPNAIPAYTFTVFTNQCGTASVEGDCYSREHGMPNSWWGGIDDDSNPQYTDLHHLFPADQYVNNRKSNYIVAQTSTPTWTSTNGSKLGPCTFPGYTGIVFEPINEYKGDFARAYLYLATRYMDVLSDWVTTYNSYDSKYIISTTGGNYLQWYINLLLLWNNSDPVSQKEIDRNNNIYYNTPQHNRNPFIDHPEYVAMIWGGGALPVIRSIANLPAAPNSSSTVSVSANITDDASIASATLQWCTNGISFGNSITMNVSTAPAYVTSSSIPAQAAGTIVTYRIVAVDSDGNTTTSIVCSYKVIKDEPSNYPTSLSTGTSTATSITLNWVDATSSVTPDGYLIKASTVSYADITDPVDGSVVANSLLVKNVAQGLQTVKFSGLSAATTYYFKIYPYTNSLANINYKTSATPPSISGTTLAGSSGSCGTDLIISEYIEGSSNNKYLEISNNTGVAVDLSDYELRLFSNGSVAIAGTSLSGTLNNQSTIVYKNINATIYGGTATVLDAINFNGDDAIALFKVSSNSYVDIFGRIGEDPGTAWTSGSFTTVNKTLVRNANVTSGVTVNPSSGFPTLATEWTQYNQDDVSHLGAHTMTCPSPCTTPITQASNINFTSVGQNSMTINWTNGDGANRIVVMSQGYPVTGNPSDGTTYTSNYIFTYGDELAPDEYVVYNNSGSSITVNGLTAGQTYYVSIFEYNCSSGSEMYLSPAATSSQVTYSIFTGTTPESSYCVTSSAGSATTIAFTSTGTYTGNTFTAQLSDAAGSFASPVSIGTLVSNSNSGVINCNIPANTPSGTGYMIRVISSGPSIVGSNSNSFEITLYTSATEPLSANASRTSVCENDGGTIDLSAVGGSGTSLVWYASSCGGTPIGTGTPLTISAPTTTTTYYARWENSCSNSSCASVTVNVNTSPVEAPISADASRTSICETDGGTIDLSAVGGSGNTLVWYASSCGGTPVGTGTPLTISAPTTTTTYYARWESTCSYSSCVSVTVNVNPNVDVSVSIAASANPVCEGTSVTFTATPTNEGTSPTFKWQLNGSDVADETNTTYSSSSFVNGDQVKCIMHSSEACVLNNPVNSNVVTLIVNPLPAGAGMISGVTTVCQGQSVETYTIPDIDNATSYIWTLPEGVTGTSSTKEISVDFGLSAVSGDITVKGHNTCGDGNASSLPITVNEKPSTPIITLLDGNVLQSNFLEGNQWFDLSGSIYGATNQNYTVTSSNTYYDIVTINGCSSEPSNSINVIVEGVDITENNISVKVYPNPVSDELVIEVAKNPTRTGFEIYSTTGQLVYKGEFTDKTRVQTTNFSKGVYLIKFESDMSLVIMKFIKN